jgi:hypothetical protein
MEQTKSTVVARAVCGRRPLFPLFKNTNFLLLLDIFGLQLLYKPQDKTAHTCSMMYIPLGGG